MNRFKNILYVNEQTIESSSAVAKAVALAERNRAKLTIIEVIPHGPELDRQERIARQNRSLASVMAAYPQRLKLDVSVVTGTLFIEVIRTVLRNGHDLVIKAAENPDFLKRLFGSDDMHLLRKCPCPVWLMKVPEKTRYDCILAAVDFNPLQFEAEVHDLNLTILEMAGSLCVSDNAALHLVHAWEAYAETAMLINGDIPNERISDHVDKQYKLHQKDLFRLWEAVRERKGMRAPAPSFHLPRGNAKKMIPLVAQDLGAELIVMGTVARTGISGLFIGNTAEAVLAQASCSVLAIKPSNFKTPVQLDA